jgi:phosphohistidine phosphatase
MNKRLILVRHGNATSGINAGSDYDRTLSQTGIEEAQEMAFRLKNKRLVPGSILSSPAIRALSTARIFAGILGTEVKDIITQDSIYESSVKSLLHTVNTLDERVDTVAIFGHNPEISDFTEYLTGSGFYQMPTCGIAVIDFAQETWTHVSQETGVMFSFDYPGADSAL